MDGRCQERLRAGMGNRYSQSIFAAALLVFVFIGFQNFYLRGENTTGPIADDLFIYAVAHGVCFTAWMVALFLQPFLIANRWRALH